jgi:hypothetical protein
MSSLDFELDSQMDQGIRHRAGARTIESQRGIEGPHHGIERLEDSFLGSE